MWTADSSSSQNLVLTYRSQRRNPGMQLMSSGRGGGTQYIWRYGDAPFTPSSRSLSINFQSHFDKIPVPKTPIWTKFS